MPLLIGLLPSVGGAYFSAPMVDEATRDTKMSLEEKGFVNYWLRHPWEYILPLYPGILLASAISKIELRDFIATVVALFLFYRYKPKAILSSLKHGFSFDVILLILGIMLFKEAMEASGAVKNVSQFFMEEGIPTFPILFLLPFVTGLLTGITIGFVGSTFPLILSITGNTSLAAISFAFASGFLRVLLSPVHVCLILTREYFKADLWGMYKMIIPAGLIVFCAAIVEYLILK